MAIQRIACSPSDLTVFVGDYSTNTTYYDSDRVLGALRHTVAEISTLIFGAVSGTETWFHTVIAMEHIGSNRNQWGNSIIEFKDVQGRRVAYMEMANTNDLQMRGLVDSGSGTSTAFQTAFDVALNQPISLDIRIDTSSGQITADFYFNQVLQGSATIANTQGALNPDRVAFGIFDVDTGFPNDSGRLYFSEMVIADEDTRTWRIREFSARGFGVHQDWSGKFRALTDGKFASGMWDNVAGNKVSFGVTNTETVTAGLTINRVICQSYGNRAPAGATSFRHYFKFPGDPLNTVFPTAGTNDTPLQVIPDYYVESFPLNPKTGVAWVPADFEGIQYGLEIRT